MSQRRKRKRDEVVEVDEEEDNRTKKKRKVDETNESSSSSDASKDDMATLDNELDEEFQKITSQTPQTNSISNATPDDESGTLSNTNSPNIVNYGDIHDRHVMSTPLPLNSRDDVEGEINDNFYSPDNLPREKTPPSQTPPHVVPPTPPSTNLRRPTRRELSYSKRPTPIPSKNTNFLITTVILSSIFVVICSVFLGQYLYRTNYSEIDDLRLRVYSHTKKMDKIIWQLNEYTMYFKAIRAIDDEIRGIYDKVNVLKQFGSTDGKIVIETPKDKELVDKTVMEMKRQLEKVQNEVKRISERDGVDEMGEFKDDVERKVKMLSGEITRLTDAIEEGDPEMMEKIENLSNMAKESMESVKELKETTEATVEKLVERTERAEKMVSKSDKEMKELVDNVQKELVAQITQEKDDPQSTSKFDFSNEEVSIKIRNIILNEDSGLKEIIEKQVQERVDAEIKDKQSGSEVVKYDHKSIEKDVVEIVKRMFEEFESDKINRTDYALETMGGEIVSTSTAYEWFKSFMWRQLPFSAFKKRIWGRVAQAEIVLRPQISLGECFALKGNTGYIEIKLPYPVIPDGFSIDHVPKSLSPDSTTAPKRFVVWGSYSRKEKEDKLGEWEYDYSKVVQSFEYTTPHEKKERSYIKYRFEFLTNHGNEKYTCIYRLRIHGKRKDMLQIGSGTK